MTKTSSKQAEGAPGRVGLWLVGARGAVATCVAYGIAGLRFGPRVNDRDLFDR